MIILNNIKGEIMDNQFSRTKMLLGKDSMEKLNNSKVIVFGVGGVGGYVVEALARSGVGSIDIVDNDTVSITNINRQIIATMDTIGEYKVDVMKKRILSINPLCMVNAYKCFFLPENQDEFDFSNYDYVIDAVDTVSAKIALVLKANSSNTPIISSMGAGNKLNPQGFMIKDIYKTSVDPLARVMRNELKKRGIKKLKVGYSEEVPIKLENNYDPILKRSIPGSNAFVPSSLGLLIASEVIKDLIK